MSDHPLNAATVKEVGVVLDGPSQTAIAGFGDKEREVKLGCRTLAHERAKL